METFRVYTGVIRVGVEWRLGELRLQLPSMAVVFGVFIVTALVATGVGFIGGVWGLTLAVLIVVLGLVLEMVIFVQVYRLAHLTPSAARITPRETTQIALIWDTAHSPVFTNYDAPDEVDGPVYRNY